MSKKMGALFAIIFSLMLVFSGCSIGKDGLDPKNPVTITMWHNYGGQMQETMDKLVDEFNITLGKEKGIILNVTSISGQKEQAEKLAMIAAGDPGAQEMPDLTTCYPASAILLHNSNLIVPLNSLFTEKELDPYMPPFLDEGRLEGGDLYVFPIAKSTEVLFVNTTLFDRFAADSGVSLNSLSTFEGIADAAVKYYRWSDAKTPDIEGDGKAFFTADSWFNIALVGSAQFGEDFAVPAGLGTAATSYEQIFNFCALPAVSGGFAVHDGYSSALAKTGDIVCSTGSTAGILFYEDIVTYPDNTIEAVSYTVLPYPVFEGGEKKAIQRGGGMVVKKSTPQKERAAAIFLQWLTAPEQNMRFVASTGYLPVTKQAFEESMKGEIEKTENENIKRLLEAAMLMYQEYDFIIAPNFDRYDALSKEYEAGLKETLLFAREAYLKGDRPAPGIVREYLSQFRRK